MSGFVFYTCVIMEDISLIGANKPDELKSKLDQVAEFINGDGFDPAVWRMKLGIEQTDNTADEDKPVSTPQKEYIDTQDAKAVLKESETPQKIDSDLVIGYGSGVSFERGNDTVQDGIKITNSGGSEQMEIGDTDIPLKLKHAALDINGTAHDRNIEVAVNDGENTVKELLAYKSDIDALNAEADGELADAVEALQDLIAEKEAASDEADETLQGNLEQAVADIEGLIAEKETASNEADETLQGNIDTKLDRVDATADLDRAYVVTSGGEQTMYEIDQAAETPDTLARRGSYGEVKTATPHQDADAANKAYVDDLRDDLDTETERATAAENAKVDKTVMASAETANGVVSKVAGDYYTDAATDSMSLHITVRSIVDGTVLSDTAIPLKLASEVSRGLMTKEQVASLNELLNRVASLEGKTSRYIYTANDTPSANQINAFMVANGHTAPFEGVAVVVAGTYHIWHYYENEDENGDIIGWRDDGSDTVNFASQTEAGIIIGSEEEGYCFVESNHSLSVVGFDALKGRITSLENTRLNDITIESGTNNGTIKITKNKNGTNTVTDNIAVKGLGSAAFAATTAFATAAQGSKADSALQSETDPTVPAWAKAATKPTYTASEVGAATAAQGSKADSAYQKPSTGIPKPDLASGVQTTLGKADSSVQGVKFNGTEQTITNGVAEISVTGVVTAEQQELINNALQRKTTNGDYVYIHNGTSQNEKAYTIAPTASTIAERTNSGTLRGATATDNNDLVNLGQMKENTIPLKSNSVSFASTDDPNFWNTFFTAWGYRKSGFTMSWISATNPNAQYFPNPEFITGANSSGSNCVFEIIATAENSSSQKRFIVNMYIYNNLGNRFYQAVGIQEASPNYNITKGSWKTLSFNNPQLTSTNQASTTAAERANLNGKAIATVDEIPTIYEWAKAASKPTYTASEVGAVAKLQNQAQVSWTSGSSTAGQYIRVARWIAYDGYCAVNIHASTAGNSNITMNAVVIIATANGNVGGVRTFGDTTNALTPNLIVCTQETYSGNYKWNELWLKLPYSYLKISAFAEAVTGTPGYNAQLTLLDGALQTTAPAGSQATYNYQTNANAIWNADLQMIADKANDTAVVHNTGNETIAGEKNFTGVLKQGGNTVMTLQGVEVVSGAKTFSAQITASGGISNLAALLRALPEG